MSPLDQSAMSLRSRIRGRERWEVKALRGRPGVARELERVLLYREDILEVSANPVTGRILVIYSHETHGLDVESLIRAGLSEISSRPVEQSPNGYTDSALARILKISLPERKHLVAPLLLSIADHALSLLQSLSFIRILSIARGEEPRFLRPLGFVKLGPQLAAMTGLSVILTGAQLLVQYFRKRAWRKLGQATQEKLRAQLIIHIKKQDLEFFDSYGTGRLIKLLTDDTSQIKTFVERAGDEAIQKVLTIVVAVTALLATTPGLAILVCLPLPFIYLSSRYFGRRVSDSYTRMGESSGRFSQALENSLLGIEDVKSFTAEEQEIRRLREYSARQSQAQLDAASVSSLQTEFVGSILSTGFVMASGYGGWMAAGGRISVTEYVRAVYWFPNLLRSLTTLERITTLYHRASSSATELIKVLERQPSIVSGPVHLAAETIHGEVVFENVSFGYEPSFKVLEDVSFHLRPGETLAIVGPTGSGKSTLFRLLLRFYDVESGHIRLDSQDIRNLNLQNLRSTVSVVSQEVHLFQGTVRENVLYGQPGASEAQLNEALHDAGALDFIKRLPDGLETEVGERGQKLSGGERQRVAIARALLKLFGGASILALDEATSQLDNETEAAIKRSLRKAAHGKSVIMIAHRLTTIRSADRILVLERGKVIEQGRHDELLAQEGLYASLWHLQNEDPLGDRLEVRIRQRGDN
jgi:ATP-binding cassette, subfamily B, bacterial